MARMPDTLPLETPRGHFIARAWGRADAPVVLALHGFPDTPSSFAPLAEILAAAGFRVVAPFMRGYSPSTLEGPFHLDALAEDVPALADLLSPRAPIVLLGHDWGGAITYAAAARFAPRIRCAVAMSIPHPLALLRALVTSPAQLRRSWYMAFFQAPRLPELALSLGNYALIDRLWRDWSPGYRRSAEERNELVRCLRASMPAPIEYYRAMAWPPREALARVREAKAPARRIKIPLLHLTGGDDGCIGPSAGRGQGAFFDGPFRSETIPGVGHFLHLERPELVARPVLGWLASWGGSSWPPARKPARAG
jgi:pimeloyl-ACP methyl ester carboxylesterase